MTHLPPNPPPVVVPPPPPPLNYGRPGPRPPGNNRWWMILLRILAGMALGVGSCVAGYGLVALTSYRFGAVFFLPPMVLLGTAIFVALRFRRFGYITGVLLAPLVIGFGLVVLLFIICGSSGFKV